MPTRPTSATVSRRSLAQGAAWSVPVIAVAASAPAFAASPAKLQGGVCQVIRNNDGTGAIAMTTVMGVFGAPGAVISAGTAITYSFEVAQKVGEGIAAPQFGTGIGVGVWSKTKVRNAVMDVVGQRSTFQMTFTFTQDQTLSESGVYCIVPSLTWNRTRVGASDGVKSINDPSFPGSSTVVTISSLGAAGASATSFAFNVGSYGSSKAYRPLSFVNVTGYKNWVPQVELGGTLHQVARYASYCASNDQSTWATTCYSRCFQNHAGPCPNGTNGLLCQGGAGVSPCATCAGNTHTRNRMTSVSTCGQTDCSGGKCCEKSDASGAVECPA